MYGNMLLLCRSTGLRELMALPSYSVTYKQK